MLAAALTAVIAAVLCPGEVVFVDAGTATIVKRAPLSGAGLAIFATPDGKALVPLAGADATALVETTGVSRLWQGRLFPLFFDEPDRLHVVLPGTLATLSYPERLIIARAPLENVGGARHAACSSDGRLVALVPAGADGNNIVLAVVSGTGAVQRIGTDGTPSLVAVGLDGAWVAVAVAGDAVQIVVPGAQRASRPFPVGGTIRCLASSADGKDVLVGADLAGKGALLSLQVAAEGDKPLRERFRTLVAAPPTSIAVADDAVVAASATGVAVLGRHGKKVRQVIPIEGASAVVMMPEHPRSTLPSWGDRPVQ